MRVHITTIVRKGTHKLLSELNTDLVQRPFILDGLLNVENRSASVIGIVQFKPSTV